MYMNVSLHHITCITGFLPSNSPTSPSLPPSFSFPSHNPSTIPNTSHSPDLPGVAQVPLEDLDSNNMEVQDEIVNLPLPETDSKYVDPRNYQSTFDALTEFRVTEIPPREIKLIDSLGTGMSTVHVCTRL